MKPLLFMFAAALLSLPLTSAHAQRANSIVEWDGESSYHFTPNRRYLHHKRSARRVVEEKDIAGGWGCVTGPVDAAVHFGARKIYFFFGSQYARYDMDRNACDPGYPKAIGGGGWPGLPWTADIDAAVAYNGKAYFFKGSAYVRYDITSDRADPGYPKPIAAGWPGIWPDGIDAAVNTGDGKVLLFKGGQYVSYDIASERADGAPLLASTYLGTTQAPAGQCTTRGGCDPCIRSGGRPDASYQKLLYQNAYLPGPTTGFTFWNWHYLRDRCDGGEARRGYTIAYPGYGAHVAGDSFKKAGAAIGLVLHETSAPRGYASGKYLPTFFLDHDGVVYQLRDLDTWSFGANSNFVDSRTLSIEVANGERAFNPRTGQHRKLKLQVGGKEIVQDALTNVFVAGEICPAGRTCASIARWGIQVLFPTDAQLEALNQLVSFILNNLRFAVGHRIPSRWLTAEFSLPSLQPGAVLLPGSIPVPGTTLQVGAERFFLLTAGGANLFREAEAQHNAGAALTCESRSWMQQRFLDCPDRRQPGGVLSHGVVNVKGLDGVVPLLYVYLAQAYPALSTPAQRLAATKCLLERAATDAKGDPRLQVFFDTSRQGGVSPASAWFVNLSSSCLPAL